jgi:hypothetical protein
LQREEAASVVEEVVEELTPVKEFVAGEELLLEPQPPTTNATATNDAASSPFMRRGAFHTRCASFQAAVRSG